MRAWLVLWSLWTGVGFSEQVPVLHVVLAIDTDAGPADRDIGPACRNNGENIRAVLSNAIPASRLNIVWLEGAQTSPDGIRNVLTTQLRTTAADSLMFYYCGHGSVENRTDHVFNINRGNMKRAEIKQMLQALPARVRILMSEACSGYIDLSPEAVAGAREPSAEIFEDLFFRARGFVDFTAATFGEYGWSFGGDTGYGMFTQSFVDSLRAEESDLDTNGDKVVGWLELFYRVKKQTEETFQLAKQNAAADALIRQSAGQSPFYWDIGFDEQLLYTTHYRHQFVVPWAKYEMLSNTTWGRFNPQGALLDTLDVLRADHQAVYLRDVSGQTVWLKADGEALVQTVGETEFTSFANGQWRFPRGSNRSIWLHAGGRYEKTSDLTWIQYDANQQEVARYKMTGYGPSSVQLFDAQRNLTIQLGPTGSEWRVGGAGPFTFYQPGGWPN